MSVSPSAKSSMDLHTTISEAHVTLAHRRHVAGPPRLNISGTSSLGVKKIVPRASSLPGPQDLERKPCAYMTGDTSTTRGHSHTQARAPSTSGHVVPAPPSLTVSPSQGVAAAEWAAPQDPSAHVWQQRPHLVVPSGIAGPPAGSPQSPRSVDELWSKVRHTAWRDQPVWGNAQQTTSVHEQTQKLSGDVPDGIVDARGSWGGDGRIAAAKRAFRFLAEPSRQHQDLELFGCAMQSALQFIKTTDAEWLPLVHEAASCVLDDHDGLHTGNINLAVAALRILHRYPKPARRLAAEKLRHFINIVGRKQAAKRLQSVDCEDIEETFSLYDRAPSMVSNPWEFMSSAGLTRQQSRGRRHVGAYLLDFFSVVKDTPEHHQQALKYLKNAEKAARHAGLNPAIELKSRVSENFSALRVAIGRKNTLAAVYLVEACQSTLGSKEALGLAFAAVHVRMPDVIKPLLQSLLNGPDANPELVDEVKKAALQAANLPVIAAVFDNNFAQALAMAEKDWRFLEATAALFDRMDRDQAYSWARPALSRAIKDVAQPWPPHPQAQESHRRQTDGKSHFSRDTDSLIGSVQAQP